MNRFFVIFALMGLMSILTHAEDSSILSERIQKLCDVSRSLCEDNQIKASYSPIIVKVSGSKKLDGEAVLELKSECEKTYGGEIFGDFVSLYSHQEFGLGGDIVYFYSAVCKH